MTKKFLLISIILLGLAQISFSQTPAKKKLAVQLSENTVALFPVQYFEQTFSKMSEEKTAEMEKELSESLLIKLENSGLTADEKETVKPRLTDFIKRVSQMVKVMIMKDLKIKTAADKSLQTHYPKIFTLAELKKLDKFFKTEDGQKFVKGFNYLVTGKLDGKEAGFTDADEKEFERLAEGIGSNLFVKFTDSLIEKVMDDIGKYVEDWSNQFAKNIEKEMKTGSIKKEMDKFMSENFTK